MTALIIIFITLSLMGSALWIMPTKKDRQRMDLRMQARKLGLVVQLTSIDLPDKWDKSMNRHKVVSYSFYRIKPLDSLTETIWLLPYEVWKYHPIAEGWWSSEKIPVSEATIKTLRNRYGRLIGFKVTRDSVSLYWNESGDEQSLDDLSNVIYALAEIKQLEK